MQATNHAASRPADMQACINQTGQGENIRAGKHADMHACRVCMNVCVCVYGCHADRWNGRRAGVGNDVPHKHA